MRTRYSRLVAVLSILAAAGTPFVLCAETQASAPAGASFDGTWDGKVNNLPSVHITISEAGGKLSGNVVFYMQSRPKEGVPWRVTGEYRAPMFAPHAEGSALLFEAEHHKCHDCAEPGPNARFRMELAAPNEAQLWNLSQPAGPDSPLALHRQAEAGAGAPPPLQRGISVNMAITHSARPMPDADQPGALIVAITSDGDTYFGVNPVSPDALTEGIRSALAATADKKLYIKADARAAYASVVKILDAAHAAGADAAVLLTEQRVSPQLGERMTPLGIELFLSPPPADKH